MALARVQDAMKAEGFGILSDIDIQKAMKEKLGKDMPGYRILDRAIRRWRTRPCRRTRPSVCTCPATSRCGKGRVSASPSDR